MSTVASQMVSVGASAPKANDSIRIVAPDDSQANYAGHPAFAQNWRQVIRPLNFLHSSVAQESVSKSAR